MKSLRKIFAMLGLTAVLAVAGCAGGSAHSDVEKAKDLPPLSELTAVEDPSAYEGPTTVKIPAVDFKPIDKKATPQLPVTVTSHNLSGETQVTVEGVDRVLALSLTGSLADYVYAYGFADKLVGRDISTELPGYEDLPVVTRNGHSIDPEAVLDLNPTLIITDGSIGPVDVIEQLADAGVPVVFTNNASTFEQSYEQGRHIAEILGVPELADPLITDLQKNIEAKIAEVQHLIPTDEAKKPRAAFLYIRGEGVFYLFGEGSGIDTIFAALGVVDVAKEIGWVGERPMNDEALVKANPDTILVMTKGLASVDGVDGLLEVHPAVALTDAGKKRRVIDAPDTSLFTGATRAPQVIDALARAFYAPDSLAE